MNYQRNSAFKNSLNLPPLSSLMLLIYGLPFLEQKGYLHEILLTCEPLQALILILKDLPK